MNRILAMPALAGALALGAVFAPPIATADMTKEEFLASLGPVGGTVTLGDGIATLEVPPEFQFLPPEGAKRLLTEGWGNPPEAASDVLGMVVPIVPGPMDSLGWGVVIDYSADGFVDDKNAESIDYDKMMTAIQESAVKGNKERIDHGFPPLVVVGWATPPKYDRSSHKMYWAKELEFGGSQAHTLNYDMRILGRQGVLVLKAVAGMSQLSDVETRAKGLLPHVNFNPGHRYEEYVHGSDKRAAYGVAGLVAGGIAAKAGLFKVLWVGILAFKKVIILGVIAAAGVLRRVFGAGKASSSSPPAPPPSANVT